MPLRNEEDKTIIQTEMKKANKIIETRYKYFCLKNEVIDCLKNEYNVDISGDAFYRDIEHRIETMINRKAKKETIIKKVIELLELKSLLNDEEKHQSVLKNILKK